MRLILTVVFATLLALPATAQEADAPVLDIRPAEDIVLGDFLWLNRLIVVFANTDRDPNFREQLELLAARPVDLLDREVIIVTDTDPANPSALREELRPRGFGWVLIDKDGVIKLRKPTPWHVREIVRSIDKTELRQQEVRDRQEAAE
ncbi:MAG: DUF4174 domain-containing protein [Paracoccaceae bacterium]|nr:DUF4174 domain-containing protein [Paracoccaceae bacterium]